MEICNLNYREFKIAVLKKNSTRPKKRDMQFNELRKQINKQNEYFTKDIESFKKNQTEILEMKSSIK